MLMDAGIDVTEYPTLLNYAVEYCMSSVVRDLIAAGIPKETLYDAEYMKKPSYRAALARVV